MLGLFYFAVERGIEVAKGIYDKCIFSNDTLIQMIDY